MGDLPTLIAIEGGGNTIRLLRYFQESEVGDLLVDAAEDSPLLAGACGGALPVGREQILIVSVGD